MIAASTPPESGPTRYIHKLPMFPEIMFCPKATAGLKAPPEIPPPAKAAITTAKPIASP